MSKKKLTNGDAEEVDQESPEVNSTAEEESPKRGSKRAKTESKYTEGNSNSEEEDDAPKRGSKRAKTKSKYTEGSSNSEEEDDAPKRTSKRAKTPKSDKKDSRKKSSRKRSPSKAAKEESDEEDDTEYEVQKILAVKTEKGKKIYLVNWKGYSSKENSWEPETNLSCTDLIEDYLKNKGQKPAKAGKAEKTEKRSPGRKKH